MENNCHFSYLVLAFSEINCGSNLVLKLKKTHSLTFGTRHLANNNQSSSENECKKHCSVKNEYEYVTFFWTKNITCNIVILRSTSLYLLPQDIPKCSLQRFNLEWYTMLLAKCLNQWTHLVKVVLRHGGK